MKKSDTLPALPEYKYPPIRTAFGPHVRVSVDFSQGGIAQQNFKDECDINRIMKRFLATNTLPNVNPLIPQFADVTGLDFREAMELTVAAGELFNQLPALLRERFQHNPGLFLDYVNNPDNAREMASLGLLNDAAAARVLTPPAAPAAPTPPAAKP